MNELDAFDPDMRFDNSTPYSAFEAFGQKAPELYSLEAEQLIIASLLQNSEASDYAMATLVSDDFFTFTQRSFFTAAKELFSDGISIDVLTLRDRYIRVVSPAQDLDPDSALRVLNDLFELPRSWANNHSHSDAVKRLSICRQLRKVGQDISGLANLPDDADDLMAKAEGMIGGIAAASAGTKGVGIRDVMMEVVELINARFEADGALSGLSTGLADLDAATGGLQDGDLVIVAGRPSMGKTSFAMNIAQFVSMKEPVTVFSLEMTSVGLGQRMVSNLSSLNLTSVISGKLTEQDWPKITSGISLARDFKMVIDDDSDMTIDKIRSRARVYARENGCSLIVVDYLQLISAHAERHDLGVGEITRGLKAMAKELNVPVIALSQLNRGLEKRPDKRPIMADLRDSGAIEQDADLVIMQYRDEVYDENSMMRGLAEHIIRKNRNGPLETVVSQWLPEFQRFTDFTGQVPQQERETKTRLSRRHPTTEKGEAY